MSKKAVILDTCFLINLQDEKHIFHIQAKEYYKYFLDNQMAMYVSTISIAEYSTNGDFRNELPVEKFKIIPFTIAHSFRAGEFAKLALANRKRIETGSGYSRIAITNDIKLFAQADVEIQIKHFITADAKISNTYLAVTQCPTVPSFEIINITTPIVEVFPNSENEIIEVVISTQPQPEDLFNNPHQSVTNPQ